ncbi:hypothetical protein HPB52_013134 [Rhipicephalus sanguineus]|uniref:Uncharacterized protein n=1 Tax=Rhipicephalus sanguineus TaxID=34632 RepID=A0A9D4QDJ4_RHISA|nr:hypothetical protein HPB52_013134 [Rhipicephalus sanguineus]
MSSGSTQVCPSKPPQKVDGVHHLAWRGQGSFDSIQIVRIFRLLSCAGNKLHYLLVAENFCCVSVRICVGDHEVIEVMICVHLVASTKLFPKTGR